MAELIKLALLQEDHLATLLQGQPDQQQETILQQLLLTGTVQEVQHEVQVLQEAQLEAQVLQEVQREVQVLLEARQAAQVLQQEAQVLLGQVLRQEVQVLLDQVLPREAQVLPDRVLHLQGVQVLQVEVAQAEEENNKIIALKNKLG